MAAKKKTTKRKARSRKQKPPTPDEFGDVYMSELDLKTLELADYKWRCVKQARALKEHERVEVVGRLDKNIRELVGAESKRLGELKNVRRELGEKYGVNFDDPSLSYDDETGRLITMDQLAKT